MQITYKILCQKHRAKSNYITFRVHILTFSNTNAEELSQYLHAESGLSDKREQIAPGSILFRNELGGTVVTIAANLVPCPNNLTAYWYFNETRKRQTIKILRSFGNAQPNGIIFLGDEPAICLTGTSHNGDKIIVLDNIGMDTIENPEFDGQVPEKLERLGNDGAWLPVEFEKTGNTYRILSPVESFRPAVFRYY